jgi:hypothetical protein
MKETLIKAEMQQLVATQRPGGFALPERVLAAWSKYQEVAAVEVPEAQGVHLIDTAHRLADAVRAGGNCDIVEAARELASARAEAQVALDAQLIWKETTDELLRSAHSAVQASAVAIVSNHLAPVHEQVLTEAHGLAEDLRAGGVSMIDPPPAWKPLPAKAAAAAAKFAELATQRVVLVEAAVKVWRLGELVCADDPGVFGWFRHPELLVATWSPEGTARLVVPELPQGPVSRLWYLVGDGWIGEPWLPTPAQRDERWNELFGKQRAKRLAAAEQTRALIGGR